MIRSNKIYAVDSWKEGFFSFLMVLFAWANTYKLPNVPIGLGEVLIFLFIPLCFKRKMLLPFERQEIGFVLYFFYMAIASLVLGVIFDAPMSKFFSVLRVGFYWVLVFYFGKNLFKKDVFEKCMVAFAVLLSSFIIIQWVVYLSTGFYIPGIISSLPLNRAETASELYERSLSLASWRGFIRPNGFLQEPGTCSQMLFICMMSLVCNKIMRFRKKMMLMALISFATIVTQSVTGVTLLVFAWLALMTIEKRMLILRIPLIISLFFLCLYVFFYGDMFGLSSIERIFNVVNNSDIDRSSSTRLYNGLDLFAQLPFEFKIFGTGMGLFEYASDYFVMGDALNYKNALSGILFSTGFIGLVIWLAAQITLFVMSDLFGKILVIGFFIMSLGCSIFCQPQMVWFLLLIYADIKKKKGIDNVKVTGTLSCGRFN